MPFKLHAPYSPGGDQPSAIAQLTEGLQNGDMQQTLLGVTGSGKTFTIANVIANYVSSHSFYEQLRDLYMKDVRDKIDSSAALTEVN